MQFLTISGALIIVWLGLYLIAGTAASFIEWDLSYLMSAATWHAGARFCFVFVGICGSVLTLVLLPDSKK